MPKYQDNDLLTIKQAAVHFGYAEDYLRALNAEHSAAADPMFRRMRIKTDETWRKAFDCSAHYVYQYDDLKRWFADHQASPHVQSYNASHGIEVDL